jgi:peptidyl-prolyl cis-trans isomerase D
MSVIQKIREKYLGVMIGAIVLALVGFLVMDSFQNNSLSLFGDSSNTIGSVNGVAINNAEYTDIENRYSANALKENPDMNETDQEQVRLSAWSDYVNQKLLEGEYDKLGLNVSDKELIDMETDLNFADQTIRQQFSDPSTGVFDPTKVTQFLASLRGGKADSNQRKAWASLEKQIIEQRVAQKYSALLSIGVNYPKGLLDAKIAERNSVAAVDFVKVTYDKIEDSKVKVTDEDMKTYMTKYSSLFTLPEDFRKFDYVAFEVVPTAKDTAASLGFINNIAADFASTTNVREFLGKNNSEDVFDDNFYAKGVSSNKAIDTAINAPVGAVLGPIYDKGAFKLVKVVDKKNLPDSCKASHILIGVSQALSADDAEKKIDSIIAEVKKGANFGALAAAFSDDQSNKTKGGDLGYFGKGMMMKEFNDSSFFGAKGDLKKVKTSYGWHALLITDQKDFKPCAQVATLSKALRASEETKQVAYAKAQAFDAKAKTKEGFDKATKDGGYTKRVAENLTGAQTVVNGLGSSRELVRWAFETKLNTVSGIKNAKDGYLDKYVVACLSEISPKGLAPVGMVRSQLEGEIRKQKKAKMIAEQYKGKSLQDIATANAVTVASADTILLAGTSNPVLGSEAKVIGAAFNASNKGKVSNGIAGNDGVFFITVKNIVASTVPVTEEDRSRERQMMGMSLNQSMSRAIPGILKKKANIVDNRSKY